MLSMEAGVLPPGPQKSSNGHLWLEDSLHLPGPFSELHYWDSAYLYSKKNLTFALGSQEIISICLGPWVSVRLTVRAGHTRKNHSMIYGRALGHAIPVNLTTENNYMDNQSIMPTWWSPSKISEYQSFPGLQYFMQIVTQQCKNSNTPWLHGEKPMEVQSLVVPWTPFYVLVPLLTLLCILSP